MGKTGADNSGQHNGSCTAGYHPHCIGNTSHLSYTQGYAGPTNQGLGSLRNGNLKLSDASA